MKAENRLLLDPTCPGWRVFGEMYDNALEVLREAGPVT